VRYFSLIDNTTVQIKSNAIKIKHLLADIAPETETGNGETMPKRDAP
jgi:predicted RNA binding protein with dsRBD fold (UPF0201 family)